MKKNLFLFSLLFSCSCVAENVRYVGVDIGHSKTNVSGFESDKVAKVSGTTFGVHGGYLHRIYGPFMLGAQGSLGKVEGAKSGSYVHNINIQNAHINYNRNLSIDRKISQGIYGSFGPILALRPHEKAISFVHGGYRMNQYKFCYKSVNIPDEKKERIVYSPFIEVGAKYFLTPKVMFTSAYGIQSEKEFKTVDIRLKAKDKKYFYAGLSYVI